MKKNTTTKRKCVKRTPPFSEYPEWSEAKFWGFIRSALRSKMSRWPPKIEAKNKARRKYVGDNKQQKWEYQCNHCYEWFKDKEVEVNHITPAGTLRSYNDLPLFVKNLFCGSDGFEVVCKPCHQKETKRQKEAGEFTEGRE